MSDLHQDSRFPTTPVCLTEEDIYLDALYQEIGRAVDAANAAREREDHETARMEEARHLRLSKAHRLATEAIQVSANA